MTYKKTMISIPENVLREVDDVGRRMTNGNRSAFITQAVREKLENMVAQDERKKLRQAYKATADDGLDTTKEWESTDDDLWQQLYGQDGSDK